MSWKEDKRAPLGLWAPGDYLCTCARCDERFQGDKRARHCADCEYTAAQKELCSDIAKLQHRAGAIGMLQTTHKLHEANVTAGFELADIIAAQTKSIWQKIKDHSAGRGRRR